MEVQLEKEVQLATAPTSLVGGKIDEMETKESYDSSGAMNFASVEWTVEENDPLFDPNAAGFSNSSHPELHNEAAENSAENDLFSTHNDFLAVDPREVRRAETAPMVLTIIGSDGSLCIGDDVDEAAPGEEYRYTEEYHALYYSKMPRDPRMPLPLTRRRLMTFGTSNSNSNNSTSRRLNAAVGSESEMNEAMTKGQDSASYTVLSNTTNAITTTPNDSRDARLKSYEQRAQLSRQDDGGEEEERSSRPRGNRSYETNITTSTITANVSSGTTTSSNSELFGNKARGNYPSRSKSNSAVRSRINVSGAVGDERDMSATFETKMESKDSPIEQRGGGGSIRGNEKVKCAQQPSGATATTPAVLLSPHSLHTFAQDTTASCATTGSKDPSTDAGFVVMAATPTTTTEEDVATVQTTGRVTTIAQPQTQQQQQQTRYYDKSKAPNTQAAKNRNTSSSTTYNSGGNNKMILQAPSLASLEASFHEVSGHVVECSRDQNGSRLVQHLLEQQDYFLPIYAEVMANFEALALDLYGNYVIQHVFDVLAEKAKNTGDGDTAEEKEEENSSKASYETRDAALAATIAAFSPSSADMETSNNHDIHVEDTSPGVVGESKEGSVHRFTAAGLMQQILDAKVRGNLKRYAFETYGCRAMQKALECMPRSDREVILHELDDCIVECVYNANANHVVQKILEKSPEKCQHIIDAFVPHIKPMACHAYGCRVLQRIFEECHDVAGVTIEPLLQAVLDHLSEFTIHQYGNYVVQYALLNAPPTLRRQFMVQLLPQVYALSCSKFASNVAEKVVSLVDEDEREELIGLLTKPLRDSQGGNYLVNMMQDGYANYVVQRFLEAASEAQRSRIGEVMAPYLVTVYHSIYGQHLLRKMETLNVISSEMLRERGIDLNTALPLNQPHNLNNNSSNNTVPVLMMNPDGSTVGRTLPLPPPAASSSMQGTMGPSASSFSRRHGPRYNGNNTNGASSQRQVAQRQNNAAPEAVGFYFQHGRTAMPPTTTMMAPSHVPAAGPMMMPGSYPIAPPALFAQPPPPTNNVHPSQTYATPTGMTGTTRMGFNGMSGHPSQGFVAAPLPHSPTANRRNSNTTTTATPPQSMRRASTVSATTTTNGGNNTVSNHSNGGQSGIMTRSSGGANNIVMPQPVGGYQAMSPPSSSSSPQAPPTVDSSSSAAPMPQQPNGINTADMSSPYNGNHYDEGVSGNGYEGGNEEQRAMQHTMAQATNGGPFQLPTPNHTSQPVRFAFATPTHTTAVMSKGSSPHSGMAAAALGSNATRSMLPQTVVINGFTYRYVPAMSESVMEAASSLVASENSRSCDTANTNNAMAAAQGPPMTMSGMLMEQSNMHNNNNNQAGGFYDQYGGEQGGMMASGETLYNNTNTNSTYNSSNNMHFANSAQAAAATLLYCGGPFAANQPAMQMSFVNPANMNAQGTGSSNGGSGGSNGTMMYAAGPMPQTGPYMNHGGSGIPPSFMMPVARPM